MSYTFICTPQKEWWLKISTMDELLDYFKEKFRPKLEEALNTIEETEFGKNKRHADYVQSTIGVLAKGFETVYENAFEKLLEDNMSGQYKALRDGKTLYINRNCGWNISQKTVEQFVHKNNLDFPVMRADKIKIEKFPFGTHYYVFIDGVQMRKEENLKFNTYEEAYSFAKNYIKR